MQNEWDVHYLDQFIDDFVFFKSWGCYRIRYVLKQFEWRRNNNVDENQRRNQIELKHLSKNDDEDPDFESRIFSYFILKNKMKEFIDIG